MDPWFPLLGSERWNQEMGSVMPGRTGQALVRKSHMCDQVSVPPCYDIFKELPTSPHTPPGFINDKISEACVGFRR